MLKAQKRKSNTIISVERKDDSLYLYSEKGMYRLMPKCAQIVRITFTARDKFMETEKPGIVDTLLFSEWKHTQTDQQVLLKTKELTVIIQKDTASFSFYDSDGKLLLRERAENSKELDEFTAYRIADGAEVKKEVVVTADGSKEVIHAADKVEEGTLYHTRLYLDWQKDEALYGLGQQEEGLLNLRGQMLFIHQANKKIAIPMLISSLGYGILMDTYSPMIFSDTVYSSYLYTEADYEMDYYFINGSSMDGVVKGYRKLTGKAAMLPKWAFGYIQSQERYETADEILKIAEEYRKREIGLDALVLDWCSWEDGKWGQKTFDSIRFPHPEKMIDKLHDNNIHFMISVWPNASENCENYGEFHEKGLHLPAGGIYNAIKREGRSLYWNQLERGLFSKGVDAWWCDSSEPFTPEWNHLGKMEAANQYTEYFQSLCNYMPSWLTNAYCLYHAQAIYEGQRKSQENSLSEKRVMNLTRSGYTGQQRYGTVLWSGDISASWDTMKRQIAASLNFCASGLPYWTVDIGAFFVKKGVPWYWDGDYEKAAEDLGYRELFVRWYQWGCFLPIFRGHGTDCRRELWEFGEKGEIFYDALVGINKLRYELMPYIYSQAGKVWMEDASFIKMLAFAFTDDKQALEISDQYIFGDCMMVCPVIQPMYYGKGSCQITNVARSRQVYLPKGQGWYDYWTNQYYEGGQWIEADAEINKIPLFVKEGSIIPMTSFTTSVFNNGKNISLRIYAGKDASFSLYEDAGDGYGYEKGEYTLRELHWNEEVQKLHIEQNFVSETNRYEAEIVNSIMIQKERK
ncbi:MAG TPA: TIM-barrel domain-containing protein [Lachnospiraceae bacterium]|nr:TIM-barrel domain-containing protein [Lachnospiraceae bacterium]